MTVSASGSKALEPHAAAIMSRVVEVMARHLPVNPGGRFSMK